MLKEEWIVYMCQKALKIPAWKTMLNQRSAVFLILLNLAIDNTRYKIDRSDDNKFKAVKYEIISKLDLYLSFAKKLKGTDLIDLMMELKEGKR